MSEKTRTAQEARDEAIRAANQMVIRQSHKIHAEHAAHCDGECFKNAGHAAVMTIVELMRERDAAMRANDAMAAAVNAIADERDALRAIVEGRTTPPTYAEIDAHEVAGGLWRWQNLPDDPAGPRFGHARAAEAMYFCRFPLRWWPLDATGRPCAWPVATEAPRG